MKRIAFVLVIAKSKILLLVPFSCEHARVIKLTHFTTNIEFYLIILDIKFFTFSNSDNVRFSNSNSRTHLVFATTSLCYAHFNNLRFSTIINRIDSNFICGKWSPFLLFVTQQCNITKFYCHVNKVGLTWCKRRTHPTLWQDKIRLPRWMRHSIV